MKLSRYWNANKRQIKRNWKKEIIREKHNFSMLQYIASITDHIENDIGLIEHDISMGSIERELYTTL